MICADVLVLDPLPGLDQEYMAIDPPLPGEGTCAKVPLSPNPEGGL